MSAADRKFVIIGAGIAGLSLGWELAKTGANITILEKGAVASGASGAAGGWLQPRPGKGKLRALEWASLNRWPEYARLLEQAAGVETGFRKHGIIQVTDSTGLEKLRSAARFHTESGWQTEWLEGEALRKFEPGLSNKIVAGCFLPQVCHLDARQSCHALARAFEKSGGILHENVAVREAETTGNTVHIHTETGGLVEADIVVFAAAHGTNTIAGLPVDMPKSRPVRGILLELATNQPLVLRPVKTPDYIVLPLSDQRLMVGSSHEDGEDRLDIPEKIVKHILSSVSAAVPEISGLEAVEERVGIRALVGDGLLRLGRSSKIRQFYYSISHAGGGFLRAPVIAQELANIILDPDFKPRWIGPFFRS